jgi:hypothetical protein
MELGLALAVAILDAESSTRISPFNVVINMTNNSTCAALDAALVRKKNSSIFLRGVTVRGATIDALLAGTLEANIAVDDPDMGAGAINIVNVERKFLLDRGRIKDTRSCSRFNDCAHQPNP